MTEAEKIKLLEEQIAEVDDSPTAGIREKIDLMNELAWLLHDKDTIRSFELSQYAYALAESEEGSGQPYQAGLAYSLRTQGYLNQRLGNLSLSFVQLMKAQGAFRSLDIYDGLSDVYGGIADIYFQIGNFADALVWISRQLEAAQQNGDKRRVADAINNLAKVYIQSEDYEQAESSLNQSLKFALESGYTRIACLSFLNIAEIRLRGGRYEEALEAGLRGLDLSREAGFELFEVHSLDILGKIYLKLGDREEGLKNLETALVLSREIDSKPVSCRLLISLGKVNLELQQPDLAIESLEQSLSIAHSIQASVEIYKAHQALSEAYEQMGNVSSALQHYKQFQAIQAMAMGEKATLRTNILQIDHQTESAKKEAEIAHLRTVELQNSISEKEKAQQRLQRQLEYARALSACSQTLLGQAGEKDENYHQLLTKALHHLLEPTHVSMISLYENVDDPKLGLCSRLFVDAPAPGFQSEFDHPDSKRILISWSAASIENEHQLAEGNPVGGLIKDLFANSPDFRDFLLNEMHVLSVQFFPIFFHDHWWGLLSFDDRVNEREWDADEVLLLKATTEIIKSSLQRRQAQMELRALNNQLEQIVEARTTELRDTINKLSNEVGERQRAERSLQELMGSLEQHLIARTNELATFFDLILMSGQGVDLGEIFENVSYQVMEITQSNAVSINVIEADGEHMHLIGQANIPEQAPRRVKISEFPPEMRRWMGEPNEPLLISDLEKEIPSFVTAFDFSTYKSVLYAQIRVSDRIEGVMGCYRVEKDGYEVDVVALVTAVAQQLGLILEIDQLREQSRSLAVLEERERVSRELHDSIAQKLYSLNLFAHAGQEAAEDGELEGVRLRLNQVEENALSALREMRLMLYRLRPMALESHSLTSAIEDRFNLVERQFSIAAVLQVDYAPELTEKVEEELFYIISEALNNALKHAQATRVKVHFASKDNHLQVTIQDNGKGFDPHQPHKGMGLENIYLRTEKIDGRVELESAIGQGTTIRIIL